MKISEMTLEQLQDHALKLESDLAASKDREDGLNAKISELTGLNLDLQKRNNALFIQVEQQAAPPQENPPAPPASVESCEDFARNLIIGDKK